MADPLTLLSLRREGETRTALVNGTTLLEYYTEGPEAQSQAGSLFIGRVERVLPDVRAAFVNIGPGHNAFLPLKESSSFHERQGNASPRTGDEIIVQVKRDAHGTKGALVSRDIVLPGQYVLLLPMSGFISASRRVESESERKKLIRRGHALSGGEFGLIMRHAALFAKEAAIREEIASLRALWQKLSEKAPAIKAPALLFQEASAAESLLRDYSARCDIRVKANYAPSGNSPAWETVSPEEAARLWQAARVEAGLKAALRRVVPLSSGGSLVIDEREALHTIDVNTGSDVKAPEGMTLPLYENLNATPEIARQIRLRNLSGIILVDFLDMSNDTERATVREAMEKAVAEDRVKTVIHGFTSLGLLEMTRRRTGDSLLSLHTESCGRCGGSGRAPRKETRENQENPPSTDLDPNDC